MKLTRRELLIGLTGIAGSAFACSRRRHDASGQTEVEMIFPLTLHMNLEKAFDLVVPGSAAAGVMAYCAYWLSQKHFQANRTSLLAGAKMLDIVALDKLRKAFLECSALEQDGLLRQFAKGRVRKGDFDGKVFFRQLIETALESYLADPKYGGNKDMVGWKFVGAPDGMRSCWWNPKGVQLALFRERGFHD